MTLLKISSMADVLSGSLTAIIVVFGVLVLLIWAFTFVGKMSRRSYTKRMVKQGVITKEEAKTIGNIPANDVAAISMAMHLFLNEVHDDESNIITIKQVERRYSPWNSKIYGLTNLR